MFVLLATMLVSAIKPNPLIRPGPHWGCAREFLMRKVIGVVVLVVALVLRTPN